MDIDQFFNRAFDEYSKKNPTVKKINDLIISREEKIVNDHIAIRTFDHLGFNKEYIFDYFKKFGYEKKGEYFFQQKKLKAIHLELIGFPKIFISELLLDEFPGVVRNTFMELGESYGNLDFEDLFFNHRPWKASYKKYEEFCHLSEYAGWVYAHGICANHFTVSFNELKSFKSLFDLNEFLKDQNILLNNSGGEIKGSPEVYLEQSSTMADKNQINFSEGVYRIPGSYYEFTKRYVKKGDTLFQGFVEGSADKIFESTHD